MSHYLEQRDEQERERLADSAILSYDTLDEALVARQKVWGSDGGVEFPKEFYAIEFVGEIGELFNNMKKIMRENYGARGSRSSKRDLEDEFGDALITLKNLAMKYDVDLDRVAKRKFNETSIKYGFPHRVELK